MKILKYLVVFVLVYGVVQGAKYLYFKPNFSSGELAADFSINESLKLSDLKGDYVLLDFWGSWCGPCIGEFPKVSELYQNYHGKKFESGGDFEVIGVAVETNEKRWQKAIDKFGLPWQYQVMDKATSLRFFDSPIADEYGVNEVPTKFLIDPNGNIVDANAPRPSDPRLKALLNSLL